MVYLILIPREQGMEKNYYWRFCKNRRQKKIIVGDSIKTRDRNIYLYTYTSAIVIVHWYRYNCLFGIHVTDIFSFDTACWWHSINATVERASWERLARGILDCTFVSIILFSNFQWTSSPLLFMIFWRKESVYLHKH